MHAVQSPQRCCLDTALMCSDRGAWTLPLYKRQNGILSIAGLAAIGIDISLK